MFRLIVAHNQRIDIFHDGHRRKTFTFRDFLPKKIHFLFLHCTSDEPQMPEVFVIWTLRNDRTRLSRKQLTSFHHSTSLSETFYMFRNIPLQKLFLFCAMKH